MRRPHALFLELLWLFAYRPLALDAAEALIELLGAFNQGVRRRSLEGIAPAGSAPGHEHRPRGISAIWRGSCSAEIEDPLQIAPPGLPASASSASNFNTGPRFLALSSVFSSSNRPSARSNSPSAAR
jgi:hypothetical protein